jgi:pimeloyl-ACP methyl ester carboxylesterase
MNTFRRGKIMVLVAINGLFAVTSTIAATSSADSNITTVDTRGVSITSPPQSQTINADANLTFTVVAAGVTPFGYQWLFNGNSLAGQTATNLSLTNVQFANAGGYSVIVTNAFGSVTSAVAQLTVFTNLVVTQTNKPPPPPGNPTIPTDTNHFKVFTNGSFVSGIGLDPNKSTIVLTHGWKESSATWPLDMANNIKFELGSSTPNIVVWDWTTKAAQPLPAATLETQGQGYALGENLTNALGANYSHRIHFIGHSLGTLVNARAANFIHTNGFAWANTQMTLLDDAEVAWGLIGNSWATLTSLLENDSSPQQDWKHPLPDQCAWADNYITAVGMPHPQAVNVILTNLAPDLSNIQNLFDFGIGAWTGQFKTEITDYHNYSYIWYNNTVSQINNPNDPPYPMGFLRSWEGGGYAGRPSANTNYIESTICPPSFPSYSGYDPAYNLVQITSDQANQHLNARPQNLISQVGVNLVSSSANILANNNNQVQVQLLNGPAVNASSLITGPAYAFATLIKLFTMSLINGNGPIRPKGGSPTNSPAYVWIPVTVPSHALTMAFNFMLQGNGKQDSFQVALNSNNLMTVETVLIQTNVTMSSGMLDVSQYAGQQAELFFGIVGGTSTNAIVTISDIAFYVTLPPPLQIQLAGTNVVVSWPFWAAGFVLESTDKLRATNSWTAVTNVPEVVNFQYTVTNQVSGGSRFYRLAKTSTVAPALQAQVSGSSFVLSWPASAQNSSLQTTTNLTDANSWTAVTNVPAVLKQQNVITNGTADRMRFYRLKMQ